MYTLTVLYIHACIHIHIEWRQCWATITTMLDIAASSMWLTIAHSLTGTALINSSKRLLNQGSSSAEFLSKPAMFNFCHCSMLNALLPLPTNATNPNKSTTNGNKWISMHGIMDLLLTNCKANSGNSDTVFLQFYWVFGRVWL